MQSFVRFFSVSLGLAGAASAIGLHLGTLDNFLLISPSLSGDGISLFPALHPEHDLNDLNHLVPQLAHDLHYSQEGHRPALHGAKHAQFQATFTRPTVVLEHSNQISKIKCQSDEIEICFKSPEARRITQDSWTGAGYDSFNIVTYHRSCGDGTGERRSFFQASRPVFDSSTCLTVPATRIDEKDALDSGEVSWGTYASPLHKREPVLGHVRAVWPDEPLISGRAMAGGNGSAPTGNGTVDLTTNAWAVEEFFGTDDIDTSVPDREVMPGLDFLTTQGELEKRGLWSWLVQGLTSVANAWKSFTNAVLSAVQFAASAFETYAAFVIDLYLIPFGVPFERGFHEDLKFDYVVRGNPGDAPKIGGYGTGVVLAETGGDMYMQCAKCGIVGELTLDGHVAFSIAKGLTKGELSLMSKKDLTLSAIFGLTIRGKWVKEIQKPVGAPLPLAPFTIPGIINIGPQLALSAAASFYVDAQADFLVGGELTMSPGIASLSLTSEDKNRFEGFEPSFKDAFEVLSLSGIATAELGLPISLEIGVDVLSGTFKRTAAFINTPSAYVTAGVSTGSRCDGAELRAGLKNRLYSAAFSKWEYEFKTWKLYEKGLGCIGPNGFSSDEVEGDESIFLDTQEELDEKGITPNRTIVVNNVAGDIDPKSKKYGFHVLMDKKQSAILVTGTDGYAYFVDKKSGYDLSAPWGTIDTSANTLNFDVFGRLLYHNFVNQKVGATISDHTMVEIRVANFFKMPINSRIASFAPVSHNGILIADPTKQYYSLVFKEKEKIRYYGKIIEIGDQQRIFYPTACKVPGYGLRAYATFYMVTEDGTATFGGTSDATYMYKRDLATLKGLGIDIGPKDCRTVQLVSDHGDD
ncbi:hypothetical protein FQN54_003177 [Arachnomyces sp. PD_36]|nr:hypothetical protein FQN54_003177 [Arachnomyces sp. PD_36]